MSLTSSVRCRPIAVLAILLGRTPELPAQAPPPLVVETDLLPPEQQRGMFHLPPGFEIQLVAGEPDIGQPMNMNFDARGRLWVTSSVEYPYPVAGEGVEPREEKWGKNENRPPRDWVTVLSGIDDTGKPAQVTRFAEGLNIPIGIIPDGEGAIIYSIPNIERFRDTDGDGRADERTKLYGPFGNVDTHGMAASFTRGLDGWIYATHGFRNTTKIQGTDGHIVEMNSGNTFRFKPDGSRVEHWTHGQVNPFGLCFDPWGNLYSADCHSKPLTCLLRGAYYQSFGKPHDGLGFGPDMIDHNHGSTGICGCAWYEAEQFPAEYSGCIFLCNPVTGRVHRDRIDFRGSSPWAVTQPDFITCDDGWFRPVDVKLGPDGALYVADFYNAIIGHYEVPLEHPRRDRTHGRIWRVVYVGQAAEPARPNALNVEGRALSDERRESSVESRVSSADGAPQNPPQSPAVATAGTAPAQFDLTTLSLEQLIERLGDPNIMVRLLVVQTMLERDADRARKLVERQVDSVRSKSLSDHFLVGAIWVLAEALKTGKVSMKDSESARVETHYLRAAEAMQDSVESYTSGLGGGPVEFASWNDANVRRACYAGIATAPFDAAATRYSISPEELFRIAHADLKSNPLDTHLQLQIKMALRHCISQSRMLDAALNDTLNHASLWQSVALGTHNSAGASILLRLMGHSSGKERQESIEQIARFGSEEQIQQLLGLLTASSATASRMNELADLRSVRTGLSQRGESESMQLAAWGTRLATSMLDEPASVQLGWTPVAYGPNAKPESAFGIQTRPFADGQQGALLHSSFPPGETGTGILRSDAFDLPAKLSFFIAGHNGNPSQPATANNLVRLRDAETQGVLHEALPPRNDTAQFVEWDLAPHQGRRGYIEIVDGDDRTAYAWLAVGRFSVEGLNPAAESPQLEGCKLVAELKLTELAPRLVELVRSTETPASLRGAAAGSLLALRPDARLAVLREAAGSAAISPTLREECYAAIVADAASIDVADAARVGGQAESQPHGTDASRISHGNLLKQVVQAAPADAQGQLATLLAGDRDGAAALLDLVQQGAASPRLLQDTALVERIRTWNLDSFDDRLAKLTADLPTPDAALAELLANRREHFHQASRTLQASGTLDAAPFDAKRGQALFKQHCAACHQLGGEGAKIGPQLDGVGLRGPDRLLEDILDPNRNVDAAFRTSILVLTDGRSLSGLVRREEGATLVLANTEGKEFTVPIAEIELRKNSQLSLMPSPLADKLPPDDLMSLVAYLLAPSKPTSATVP